MIGVKTSLREIETNPRHFDLFNGKIPEICWKYSPSILPHSLNYNVVVKYCDLCSHILYLLFYHSDIKPKTSSAYRVSRGFYLYLWH
jgi:hypothetical protein